MNIYTILADLDRAPKDELVGLRAICRANAKDLAMSSGKRLIWKDLGTLLTKQINRF